MPIKPTIAAAGAVAWLTLYGPAFAEDAADADAIWVTEVWNNEDSHRAALSLPAVQSAIAQAKPIIAGFDTVAVTRPVGGIGL